MRSVPHTETPTECRELCILLAIGFSVHSSITGNCTQAMMRLGKHAEALAETRGLTVEGDPAAAEVLAVRAEALYGSGNMDRAMKMYEEVGVCALYM